MLQKFSTLTRSVVRAAAFGVTGGIARAHDGWKRDPLSHPALAGMSSTELADLPHAALKAICRD